MKEIPQKQAVGLSPEESKNFESYLGDERLVNTAHAAAFLGLSPATIHNWCANTRRGKSYRPHGRKSEGKPGTVRSADERLPYIKLGHNVFFMIGDLRRFRDSRKVSA